MVYQAGGIKYFGDREIVDVGVCTDHTTMPYMSMKRGKLKLIIERKVDYIASFGDDWLDPEGISLSDTRFFIRIPVRCRGLFKVNKENIKKALEVLEQQDRIKNNIQ